MGHIVSKLVVNISVGAVPIKMLKMGMQSNEVPSVTRFELRMKITGSFHSEDSGRSFHSEAFYH